jgi:polysaccharide biosynthesis transport protein
MLQRIEDSGVTKAQSLGASGHFGREQVNDEILALLQSLRRNIRQIIWAVFIGVAISVGVLATVAPLYKGSATVLVDPRKLQLLKDREIQRDRESLSGAGAENAATDSEVEILKSPALVRRIVQKLDLQNDEEFAPGLLSRLVAGLVTPIRRLLGASTESSDPLAPYVKALTKHIDANRQKLTYVIQFDAWSEDASKAAKIANAFIELYLADQVSAKQKAGREVADWMSDRAAQLRRALSNSEDAYQKYKSQEGLFDPGGEMLTNQQIQQLNQQLVQTRAQAAAAHAKYEQLKLITPDKLDSAAASPDVLQSDVIKQLRAQYADVSKQYADSSSRYSAGHPQVVSLKAQLANLSALIKAEISRIVGSAKVEYEMAKSSQDSLEASLDDLKEKATKANQASIQLHDLDADLQANKDVYQAFLSRAKETAAQIEMQTADSRVIAAATPPIDIDFPKKSLVLAMGLFGGLVAGIGFVIARDAFAGGFRRAEDLETTFGIHPMARIPLAPIGKRGIPLLRDSNAQNLDVRPQEFVGWENPGRKAQRLASLVVDRPSCPFSESIQSLRFSLRRVASLHDVRTVLVTSALPGEGKSTLVINLARAFATEGLRTLLIDADVRDPSVAAAMGLPETYGLEDYLAGRRTLTSAIPRDRQTDLYAISSAKRVEGSRALKLLSSRQMGDLLRTAHDMFDLVLVDAPPLLPVVDARVLADQVDGVLLVVAAGQTPREALSAALREIPSLEDKLIGVTLNKTTEEFDRYYGSTTT